MINENYLKFYKYIHISSWKKNEILKNRYLTTNLLLLGFAYIL